ncbi:SGNH/GDSL hydrolase family protein [Pseudarthrobacter phenanthrenivorans]|uniref:SGNH/GDSL hydrolase family protein n=1 Tax=Pseudarthrobacter phenanthrenivorans TaxID=361575 RepID=UPI00344D77CE
MKISVRRRHSAFLAGVASLAMALGATAMPAEAATQHRDVDYVALGDSYTAGTGAGPFTPTSPCVQTPGGYVDVVGKTGRVNLVANAACHGALLDQYSSIPHSTAIPSVEQQIHALAGGALNDGTEFVSITAGANDVGVTGVLVTCLTQQSSTCLAAIQSSATYFPEMQLDLVNRLHEIRTAAPNAKIVVLGYPRLFDPAVPFGQADPLVLNSIDVAVGALNSSIEGAVTASGTSAVFVDVSQNFAGHEVNSADSWIFFSPPTVSPTGSPVFDPRNFHPNKEGHRAYASALLEAAKPAQLTLH